MIIMHSKEFLKIGLGSSRRKLYAAVLYFEHIFLHIIWILEFFMWLERRFEDLQLSCFEFSQIKRFTRPKTVPKLLHVQSDENQVDLNGLSRLVLIYVFF